MRLVTLSVFVLFAFQARMPVLAYEGEGSEGGASDRLEAAYQNVLAAYEVGMEPKALVGALKLSDPTVRVAVLHFIGKTDDRSLVAEVRPLLKAKEAKVRLAAAAALLKLGDPSGLDVVLTETKSPDQRTRLDAVLRLPAFGTEGPRKAEVLSALTAALGDSDRYVRAQAIVGVATEGGAEGVPALKKAAEDESDPAVRGVFQTQLNRLGHEPGNE